MCLHLLTYLSFFSLKHFQFLLLWCPCFLPFLVLLIEKASPDGRDTFLETSIGAWNPIFSTAPTVLNNLRLFTSSTNDLCSNWLRTSTRDLFLINLRLSTTTFSLELEAPCDPRESVHCLQKLPAMDWPGLWTSPGQNLVHLLVFVMLCWSPLVGLVLDSCSSPDK